MAWCSVKAQGQLYLYLYPVGSPDHVLLPTVVTALDEPTDSFGSWSEIFCPEKTERQIF